jgi:3-hydroxy-9,10-secoandrosta-1,3,5(10)-triene-9,17-dione monooxygenase reductase component
VAWIDCTLFATYEAGDHLVVLGEVMQLEVENARAPLLFFQGSYGRFFQHSECG